MNDSPGDGSSGFQSNNNIIYKVWAPGLCPYQNPPLLTLHSPQAVRFFVEAMTHGNSIFAGRAFHMSSYQIKNQLIEKPIASGVFQILALSGHIICQVIREDDGELISQAIKEVCDLATQHETQLL